MPHIRERRGPDSDGLPDPGSGTSDRLNEPNAGALPDGAAVPGRATDDPDVSLLASEAAAGVVQSFGAAGAASLEPDPGDDVSASGRVSASEAVHGRGATGAPLDDPGADSSLEGDPSA